MFNFLDEVCKPTRESENNMFVDLYAREDCAVGAGETISVPLGVKIDIEGLRKLVKMQQDSLSLYGQNKAGEIMDLINTSKYSDLFIKSHYLQLELHKDLKTKGLVVTPESVSLDYRDEIKLIVHNPVIGVYSKPVVINENEFIGYDYICECEENGDGVFNIQKGDKIAQVALMEHKTYLLGTEIEKEEKD